MGFSIQQIFREYGSEYIKMHKLSKEQWKVYNAVINCKTQGLGIHTITCEECGETHIALNSCRNRHCPNCQAYAREKWIEKESSNLLDCHYFHIVTTIPSELNDIVLHNQKECYDILFKATSETILELSKDNKWLGAKVGLTSVLHTWGQTLEFHPHIHSIVTGGGLQNNKWIQSKEEYLKNKYEFNKFLEPLYKKTWITYIEPPKGSPENVIEYIGRYSFRVAISNERIKNISDGKVTFEYKDYKDEGKIKTMTISAEEFIRRFLLHVLPNRFTKIRHYGILSNRNKSTIIKLCRILIGTIVNYDFSINIKRKLKEFVCPCCGGKSFLYKFHYITEHRLY